MRLVADGLAGERGGEPVFSGIGFSLENGQALIVSGPNGSGKSTLLCIVAGLLPASGGAVRLEGGGEDHPTAASACHYLGHLNAMKPALTVAENLAFWRDFLGVPDRDIGEALETVGLGGIGHLPFGYLSAGQKRRVSIARLLVARRPIWLLDEPTAALDKASETRFAGLMQAYLEQDGMIVAATHQSLGLDGAMELRMGENV